MIRRRSLSMGMAVAAVVLLIPAPAAAATPTVAWIAPGMSSASFSVDGSLVLLTANSSAGGRMEIRQAVTGTLLRTVTSPYKFAAATLSADNQLAAVTLTDTTTGASVRTIRVYRISDGTVLRSVPTAAARDLTSLDLSRDGRYAAAMEARSYKRGGRVHVHRVADGSPVSVLTVQATSATVRFSPDGRYLAANDRFISGGASVAAVRVFRTDTWASVLAFTGSNLLVRWTPDSTKIWTMEIVSIFPTTAKQVSVPGGAVLRSVAMNPYDSVSDVTDDDALLLSGRVAAPRRSLTFTSTQTGVVMTSYDFAGDVFAGDISPDQTLFTYARNTAPSAFDLYVARMPSQVPS